MKNKKVKFNIKNRKNKRCCRWYSRTPTTNKRPKYKQLKRHVLQKSNNEEIIQLIKIYSQNKQDDSDD